MVFCTTITFTTMLLRVQSKLAFVKFTRSIWQQKKEAKGRIKTITVCHSTNVYSVCIVKFHYSKIQNIPFKSQTSISVHFLNSSSTSARSGVSTADGTPSLLSSSPSVSRVRCDRTNLLSRSGALRRLVCSSTGGVGVVEISSSTSRYPSSSASSDR